MDGFTVGGTLGSGLFPVSTTNANTVDQVTLLGLVPQTAGLVGTRRTGRSVNDGELTVFPASDTRDELQHVRLLFGVELGEVLVRAHLGGLVGHESKVVLVMVQVSDGDGGSDACRYRTHLEDTPNLMDEKQRDFRQLC